MNIKPQNTLPIHSCTTWLLACAACLFASVTAFQAAAIEHPTPRYASGEVDLSDPNYVDVALVLAVDVSSSIEASERRFQREAYAEALSDPRVANMALGGSAGRVAVAYMEWSGRNFQRIHLPMRIMSTPEEMAKFAQDIRAVPDDLHDPMYVQATAIGNALLAAEHAMAQLDVRARDYIIDISGDGVVNDGTSVTTVREHLVALGLTVNGLPIEVAFELPEYEDIAAEQVSQYYADCVIGGPGSFHVIARGFSDVRETLIMKLMLEMAQMPVTQKRLIASAWNAPTQSARFIPATALSLDPQEADSVPRTDCRGADSRGTNAFQIIP